MSTGMGTRTSLVAVAVITCVVSAGASLIAASANRQAKAGPPKTDKPPTVLFMCPHGAANTGCTTSGASKAVAIASMKDTGSVTKVNDAA